MNVSISIMRTAIFAVTLFPCAVLSQTPPSPPKLNEERRADLERVFDRLTKTSEAPERHAFRNELALIRPVAMTVNFLVSKYEMVNDDVRNQIEATIGLVDFGEDAPAGFQIATKLQNNELFICVAYALANSKSREARKLTLQLAGENSLLRDHPSLSLVRAVVSRVVLDNFQPAVDTPWLIQSWNSGRYSPIQEEISIAIALKHPSTEMLPLLNRALRIARTEAERLAISTSLAEIGQSPQAVQK